MAPAETHGTAKYVVAGLDNPCETWYKVIGDLQTHIPPLLIVHGGPGACHDYLLPLVDLAEFSRPLVFYDQIGNGKSTHLSEKNGDKSFWTMELFTNEIDNLISHLDLDKKPIDVFGHSFGAAIASEWAAKSNKAAHLLRRLVLADGLASMEAWSAGLTQLRHKMPADLQEVLNRGDETQDFETPEYQEAMEVFYKRHFSLTRPWPCKEVQDALYWLEKDPTTYSTMYGPNELVMTGSLRDWTIVPYLNEIKASTLLINGVEDEAQDVAMQPFFDHIPNVKWVTLDNAAHFAHVDQRKRFVQHLAHFLQASK